ncbi:DUF397 domain-containing protein [Streptomyces sp. S465]|uniref:DUF397 domain-containing protein n=1 Tax=Streptomyces sp. S465 TaxID=2979468 RepID=UPI0022A89AAD|nr:DUF397 domain-containing protein [Streptomyces sp. S465]WAP57417.1 DUF397 domain-containing protein [Streptomyces sp. S465]
MSQPDWRKSTFSENQANCVELAITPDGIRIRESDEPEAVIHTNPATLRSFIRAVKAADLDHIR